MSARIIPFPVILFVVVVAATARSDRCFSRHFSDGFVCVCNATYCDEIGAVEYPTDHNSYVVYESTKAKLRLAHRTGSLRYSGDIDVDVSIQINVAERYQTIEGFGGAFTDSAAINYMKLDPRTRRKLIESYFSENGIEYNIGRVPMASCDFSTRVYSYANVSGDFELEHFKLADEDLHFKIPMIKAAKKSSKRRIHLFGSPWSAPAWMKTNGNMAGGGSLKGGPGSRYAKTWAKYFVKFVKEYATHDLTMWGLTSQNEPTDAPTVAKFQQMHFTAYQLRDFVAWDLGPALHGAGLKDVKLMVIDDQRLFVPYFAQAILSDGVARKYVSGIAVHWYADSFFPADILSETHKKYPDVFILPTEACQGSTPWATDKVKLGSWKRAEAYAHDIIQDLNNYAVGWTDWNLDLDLKGGPNWARNFVDSPIIVNHTSGDFYRQPMFYALGHFSKFLSRGSKRVQSAQTGSDVSTVSFITESDYMVTVVLNEDDSRKTVKISDGSGRIILDIIPERGIQTYIWNNKVKL